MSQENKLKAEMQLGHYKLTVKLAEGVFSEIWLAEHTYLENKENCLKIFTNEKFIRILSQQKFLRMIKDPLHLPYIEDYEPSGPFPYLVEEVIPGRSLRQILRERKQLKLDAAFNIIKNTIQALKKMHERNIAHLDLRPEHILVDNNGNIRLLDYIIGQITTMTIAEYYRDFTGKGVELPKAIMRSLLYKSKQHRLALDMGISADIFSLGIILFEILTGTYPTKKAEFPSQVVPNLPQKVDRIFASCCNKGEDFFSSCDEILQAIEEKEIERSLMPGISLLRDNAAIVSVTTLAGEKNYVDGKNIGILSKNLEDITNSALHFFAFDFKNIDYLNSSAIGFLVNFYDRIQNMGGVVVMFNVDKKVMTILGALGLEKVIHIVDNAQQAEELLLKKALEGINKENPMGE